MTNPLRWDWMRGFEPQWDVILNVVVGGFLFALGALLVIVPGLLLWGWLR